MDWYEDRCWQCGAPAGPDTQGRVLCSPCALWLTMSAAPSAGSRHPMEWYLTHCWRCEEASVSDDDDLGLCADCLSAMRTTARAS